MSETIGLLSIRCTLFRSLINLSVLVLACSAALSAETNQPLTTVKDIEARLGHTALVEFSVVAVKHPPRRKAVFLSSSVNFRSPECISAMIRDGDLPNLGALDDADLVQQYSGRRIRVRGKIARDEEQLVVRISSRDQLTIVESAVATPTTKDIVVVKENGQERHIKTGELARLPQKQCQVEHEGKRHTYSGVTLAAVLGHAGIPLGEESRGRQINRYIVVTASDGYQALLSVGEIDPYLRRGTVLLANLCDDGPLATAEGPWRLIITDDVRHRRWVRSVVRVHIQYADGANVQSH